MSSWTFKPQMSFHNYDLQTWWYWSKGYLLLYLDRFCAYGILFPKKTFRNRRKLQWFLSLSQFDFKKGKTEKKSFYVQILFFEFESEKFQILSSPIFSVPDPGSVLNSSKLSNQWRRSMKQAATEIVAYSPATTVYGVTSLVTTAPAPTTHPSPIVTPGKISTPPPIQQSDPIVTGREYSDTLRARGSIGCVAV